MSVIPTLVFPDAVRLALDTLAAELPALVGAPVPTGNRVPSPRPDRFVRVRRQGGTRVTVVTEAAQLGIEAWAPDVGGADELAQACRSVLFGMKGRNQERNSPLPCTCAAGPLESRKDELNGSGSRRHHRRSDRQDLHGPRRHHRAR
jgi:hypothetical protein